MYLNVLLFINYIFFLNFTEYGINFRRNVRIVKKIFFLCMPTILNQMNKV